MKLSHTIPPDQINQALDHNSEHREIIAQLNRPQVIKDLFRAKAY